MISQTRSFQLPKRDQIKTLKRWVYRLFVYVYNYRTSTIFTFTNSKQKQPRLIHKSLKTDI